MTDSGHLSAPVGSVVIERYAYTNRRGRASGVQWLVNEVNEDGDLTLIRVCKTRREAEAVRRERLARAG